MLHQKASALWSVAPEATVFDAIKLMAEKNIGALLVMSGGTLVGDFHRTRLHAQNRAAREKRPRTRACWEIISNEVISVAPDESVEECMRLMTENRVRHLPVVQNQELLGIISIGDLVNWIISTQNAAIEQMEQYIAGGLSA